MTKTNAELRCRASKQTLEAMRVTGEAIKAERKRRRYDKDRFEDHLQDLPFDRSWSFRLVKLATHFNEIVAAVKALPEGEQDWSLDGALAAFRDAKRTPEQRAERAARAAARRRARLLAALAELDADYPKKCEVRLQ